MAPTSESRIAPGAPLLRWIVLAAILLGSGLLAVRSARSMSLTLDEPGQMFLGRHLLRTGDFEELVTWGTAPLPVLATAVLPAVVAPPHVTPDDDDLAFLFRRRIFNLLLFGLPLLAVLFVTLQRWSGLAAATAGTMLLGFSPMFVPHAVIAATDVAATCFILLGTLALVRYVRAPGRGRLLLAALAIGVAMAAKQTAVILFGVAALAIWCATARTDDGTPASVPLRLRLARSIGRIAVLVAVAVPVTWAFYGFHLTTLAGPGPWRPHFSWTGTDAAGRAIRAIGYHWLLPASWVSFVVQLVHNQAGHDTFFLGELRRFGTWSYWPITLALKATLPELLLLTLVLARLAFGRAWRDARVAVPALTLALLVLGCMRSNLTLGLRYLLPAFPLALLVVFGAWDEAPRWYRRAVATVGPLLAAGQFAIAVHASPDLLSYFNGLFVPRAQAHRFTADSNLDWGQGLPSLAQAAAIKPGERVTVATWAYLNPRAYGLDAASWWSAAPDEIRRSDWLAISAGVLHERGVVLGENLAALEPDGFAELSVMLYSMHRPDVQRAVEAALAAR